jgi:hypothetical protein
MKLYPFQKLILTGIIFLLISVVGKAQDSSVQRFMASATGTDVLLIWDLKSPVSGIAEFRLFRKINQEQNFTQIAALPFQSGKSQYEFWDRTIFKDTPKWIQYRLMVVRSNGSSTPVDTYITVNPTSAQRTWGSIKSMFK